MGTFLKTCLCQCVFFLFVSVFKNVCFFSLWKRPPESTALAVLACPAAINQTPSNHFKFSWLPTHDCFGAQVAELIHSLYTTNIFFKNDIAHTTLTCDVKHISAGYTGSLCRLTLYTAHLFMGTSHHIVLLHNKSDVTGYESSYEAINIKMQTNAVCALFIMTSLHPYLQHTSRQTRRDTSSLLLKHGITNPALHSHNEYVGALGLDALIYYLLRNEILKTLQLANSF